MLGGRDCRSRPARANLWLAAAAISLLDVPAFAAERFIEVAGVEELCARAGVDDAWPSHDLTILNETDQPLAIGPKASDNRGVSRGPVVNKSDSPFRELDAPVTP